MFSSEYVIRMKYVPIIYVNVVIKILHYDC